MGQGTVLCPNFTAKRDKEPSPVPNGLINKAAVFEYMTVNEI
jgi:hypothetical protein